MGGGRVLFSLKAESVGLTVVLCVLAVREQVAALRVAV